MKESVPLPFVLSNCPFVPSDTFNLAMSTALSAIAAAVTASSSIFAAVIASFAILPSVTFKSVILIVVIAFVAKSSATIVPFTIFADVTVLSPGVRPSELISKFVGR